ncbi:hypothetical protein D3C81_1274820 [compost metagenome]
MQIDSQLAAQEILLGFFVVFVRQEILIYHSSVKQLLLVIHSSGLTFPFVDKVVAVHTPGHFPISKHMADNREAIAA